MKTAFALAVLFGTLFGCTSNPIPDGYQGATATIRDTAVPQGTTRAVFFYVSEVDGRQIENSLSLSRIGSYGKGNTITTPIAERKVPAQRLILKLEARTAYGAPIVEMWNSASMYAADALIALDAKPDAVYVVRGMLTHGTRDVWLEDATTDQRVGTNLASGQQK